MWMFLVLLQKIKLSTSFTNIEMQNLKHIVCAFHKNESMGDQKALRRKENIRPSSLLPTLYLRTDVLRSEW